MPVVFACTLQVANIENKIKRDITAVAAGPNTEAVFEFCEVDIPVSRRHRLISWAREEYGITLEIIDGSGLAEQLAQDDVFWIAERYLAVPEYFRPAQASQPQIISEQLSALLSRPPAITLPEWPDGWNEAQYNEYAPGVGAGFLSLDRVIIPNPEGGRGIEICDLLGPNNELIHVRLVRSGASFAHLYGQGIAAGQFLFSSPGARRALAERVKVLDPGRTMPGSFAPRKIVLAFPRSGRSALTPKDIPVFYRERLLGCMRPADSHAFAVDVLGIRQTWQA